MKLWTPYDTASLAPIFSTGMMKCTMKYRMPCFPETQPWGDQPIIIKETTTANDFSK